jgi:hypothetical protein
MLGENTFIPPYIRKIEMNWWDDVDRKGVVTFGGSSKTIRMECLLPVMHATHKRQAR